MSVPIVEFDRYRRYATIAFLVLLAVAVAVTTWAFYENAQTRHLVRQNRTLIRAIAHDEASVTSLQKAEDASCTNYETLKAAVNDFHGTIRAFLLAAQTARLQAAKTESDPALRRSDIEAAEQYAHILANTHTVSASCAQKSPTPVPSHG
jgi:hypothetical protein